MSDINSSLPVRTETNGDVAIKLVDGTTTTQAASVDANGSQATVIRDAAGNTVTSQTNGSQQALDVGINVAGVQIDPRDIRALTAADTVTANQGTSSTAADGWWVRPTDGTNSQAYTAAGEAKVDITQPLPAGTNLIGSVNSRTEDGAGNAITSSTAGGTRPLDVALRDGAGSLYSAGNPLPVTTSPVPPGDAINDYNKATAVTGAGTSNHDYTVTAGKTLILEQIEASASGKMKIEVAVETGVASGTFTSHFVQFNSTATPNMAIKLSAPISVAAGVRVRVIRTNKEGSADDLYSTISGLEV